MGNQQEMIRIQNELNEFIKKAYKTLSRERIRYILRINCMICQKQMHGGLKRRTMRKLKKKFKKKVQEGIVIKTSLFTKLVKIKPKQGRWCNYYEGRLPFPVECTHNKRFPEDSYFAEGGKVVIKSMPLCVECERCPQYHSWKRGDWDTIIELIKQTKDLREMDPPDQEVLYG